MILKILFIIITFGLGICFGISLKNKNFILSVLTVIGTVGAVIWAVARDTILKHINRPKLKINFYESNKPFLRYVPPDERKQPRQHVLTLYLENIGKSVAESCQPLITKFWFKENDNEDWILPSGWVPLPLNWVFQSELQQKYVDERNIVPNKPYLFNICSLLEDNRFVLTAPIRSRSQPTVFQGQKTYCIKLTVFSVNAKPKTKYFYIEWKGPFEKEIYFFKNDINVFESKNPPAVYETEEFHDNNKNNHIFHLPNVENK